MKNSFYNTFVACIILYSCFTLLGDKFLTKKTDEISADFIKSKNEVILSLCKNYNAQKIDMTYRNRIAEFIEKTVVLDSVLISRYKLDDEFYIKVSVCSEEKIYINAELRCSKTLFDKTKNMKNNTIVIAANLNGYTNSKIPVYYDTFDKGEEQFELIEEIVLKGKCLEVIEVSIFDS